MDLSAQAINLFAQRLDSFLATAEHDIRFSLLLECLLKLLSSLLFSSECILGFTPLIVAYAGLFAL